jgi:nucleotide-binding universal stress UspA family protein
MTPSTEPPSIELLSILRFHRILIPIGSSEIDHLDRVIQDISRYIHPSASLNLLGLCTTFISDPGGNIASDYQLHQTKVVNVVKNALDRIACQNGIDSSRIITCVREGGPPEVAAEARRFQADLVLLATPLWTNKVWFHNNVAQLKRLTSCSVLLLRSGSIRY